MKRIVVALLVLWASIGPARADDDAVKHTFRAVVDRVDYEPASLTGMRLRVYLSALALQGSLLDLTDAKSIKLYVGSSEKKVPYALGTYDATHGDTAIVVLVQSTIDYVDALPLIADSLDRDLMGALADKTQIVVLPFGESVSTGKLTTVKALRGKLQFTSDNSAGDPALLDSLDRALLILKKAKTTPEGRALRKLVVVIGDGRDMAADRDRVTHTGQRAAKEGVRVHTIAFSPADVRRPMLTLGELSKRSLGTFRWVRTSGADSWKAAFEQLRDEINKQYVLTYFIPSDDDVGGKKMHIVTVGRTETESNEMKIPAPTCGANECTTGYCADDKCYQYRGEGGTGVLGWILIIGGILVGGIVVLGVIGFFITKAQHQRQQQPAWPGMPGQPGMPGMPGQMPGMPGQMPGMPGMPGQMPGQMPGMMPGQMPGMQPPAKSKKDKKRKGPTPTSPPPGFLPNGRPIPALLIMSGPLTGQRHMLHNGFLIGKQPGCNLLIEDGFTSSQHAQVGMDANGACKLYDRGSTNGTYVNGVRIQETPLQHGVTIKIGSTEMRFLAE